MYEMSIATVSWSVRRRIKIQQQQPPQQTEDGPFV